MKTFNAFLYHTDKVVVNPRKEPNKSDHRNAMNHYRRKYAKWESNNIEVERILGDTIDKTCDIEYIDGANVFDIRTYDAGEGDYAYREVKIGSACTYKMSGDKAEILTLK